MVQNLQRTVIVIVANFIFAPILAFFRLNILSPASIIPFLTGRHYSFSPELLKAYSTILVVALILINIIDTQKKMSHILNQALRRCWDRGCSKDDKKTRKQLQEEYETTR